MHCGKCSLGFGSCIKWRRGKKHLQFKLSNSLFKIFSKRSKCTKKRIQGLLQSRHHSTSHVFLFAIVKQYLASRRPIINLDRHASLHLLHSYINLIIVSKTHLKSFFKVWKSGLFSIWFHNKFRNFLTLSLYTHSVSLLIVPLKTLDFTSGCFSLHSFMSFIQWLWNHWLNVWFCCGYKDSVGLGGGEADGTHALPSPRGA